VQIKFCLREAIPKPLQVSKLSTASGHTDNILGISLLVSALIQSKTLTFYQMHIIYDTTSLVMYVHQEFAPSYSLKNVV
jgi:hypothetical protein